MKQKAKTRYGWALLAALALYPATVGAQTPQRLLQPSSSTTSSTADRAAAERRLASTQARQFRERVLRPTAREDIDVQADAGGAGIGYRREQCDRWSRRCVTVYVRTGVDVYRTGVWGRRWGIRPYLYGNIYRN